MSINKVILVGNVGKDPEVANLESDLKVAKFSIATSESYIPKGKTEKVTNTEWHNIVAWRGLAGVCEKFVKKGMQVYVEGQLKTRSWENKDGVKMYTTEIFASNIQMLGRKDDGNRPPAPTIDDAPQEAKKKDGGSDEETDDLPF